MVGQYRFRMGVELEEAHGHYRPLGETWELELEKEPEVASDLGLHGEDRSGKPELGKERCLMACTYRMESQRDQ